jgi:hypothetical protein
MARRMRYLCVFFLSSTALLAQQQPVALIKPKSSAPSTQPPHEQRSAPSDSQANLPVRRVVLYKNGVGYFEHLGPVRGSQDVHIDFTSALTLDGGSFSVLENEVFAGEGLTDPIKPGERRLLSYATDLGLLVEAQQNNQPQHVTKVKIAKGTMTQISELHERTLYTVRNQDESPRVLVIEHPARLDAVLAKGTKEPEERAPGVYRFKLDLPSKSTASLPVEEVRVLQTNYQIADLNDDQIAVFSKNGTITPDVSQALQKISAQKAVVSKLEEEMELRQKDIDRIVEDQGRLRENMKALKGSSEEKALLQRYTKQLDQQETQLDVLRKSIQDTESQRDAANDQLEKMIADLQLEVTV